MNSILRIGFDAKRAFCNATGLGNYSRNIIRAMIRKYPEHQYFLFTPYITQSDFLSEMREYKHVTVIEPKGKILNGAIWRTFQLGRVTENLNLDIFHGLSSELPRIPRKHTTRYVVTMHDVIFLKEKFYYSLYDILAFSKKAHHAVKKADGIIAISDQTRNDLVQLVQADPRKITRVFQPLNPAFRSAPEPEFTELVKRKYHLPDEFILFVGRIEVRKNLQGILQALVELRGESRIPVVVVGKPSRFMKSLNDFIKIYQLKDQVILLHNKDDRELAAMYALATMTGYPSYQEGFGLPVLESIAMGTPVFTNQDGCFREAGGKFPVYINPQDSTDIARGIREILQDPRKFKPEEIFEHLYQFDDMKIAHQIMQVYEEVLSS